MLSPIKTFKQNAKRFFDSRIHKSDTHTFGLKNTYVFASKQGILFLVLLVITFIAGVNYGNNLVLAFFFYLVSMWLICIFVAFMQLASLHIVLTDITLAQTHDLAWATFAISTKSKVARQLILALPDDNHQSLLEFSKQAQYNQHKVILLPSIRPKPTLVKLPVITKQRGKNPLPHLIISCRFPFGIVVAWSYAKFDSVAWAYPKPIPFDHTLIMATHANQENDSQLNTYSGLSDFDRLDNYVLGENLARISWGHAARGMGLLTKHFLDPAGQEQILDYHAMPSPDHEDKLAMLSHAVLSQQDNPSPFMLNLPSSKGDFGVGNDFIEHTLLRLAKEP